MKSRLIHIPFLIASLASAFAVPPVVLNDRSEGQKLAAELRANKPEGNDEFGAVLIIEAPRKKERAVPLKVRVEVSEKSWRTTYSAQSERGAESLTIVRSENGAPEYSYTVAGKEITIDGDRATNSFAGSDFALIDLGTEFFHWPTQTVIKREMRKGRGCDVLESRPARTNLYSRVFSWIDQESRQQAHPGLLMAEAYDDEGKLLKEFEIKGFKKVAGQWQVKEMELRNRQAKTSTRLQFDLDKD